MNATQQFKGDCEGINSLNQYLMSYKRTTAPEKIETIQIIEKQTMTEF